MGSTKRLVPEFRRDDANMQPGLPGIDDLNEIVVDEITRHSRYGGVFSLMFLAIESPDTIHEESCYPDENTLLFDISSVVEDSIKKDVKIFNIGNNRFAILLVNSNIDIARSLAEQIYKQISSNVKGGVNTITARIGLVNWPIDGLFASDIITAGDIALSRTRGDNGNYIYCQSDNLYNSKPANTNLTNGQDDEATKIIYALAAIVDARKNYYSNHWRKVKVLATNIAQAINLEQSDIERLQTCALLHDIGKITISDVIIHKPGKLTASEQETVESHPRIGANIVSHAPQLIPCIPGILYHHEKYNGSGYPDGLRGDNIPLDARILSIADAFSVMISNRAYNRALPVEVALDEIKRESGSQFDPELVKSFSSVIKDNYYFE